MGGEAGAGDHVELVRRDSRDREIALNAAAAIEHLRVGKAAKGLGDIVGADPLQSAFGIFSDQGKFSE